MEAIARAEDIKKEESLVNASYCTNCGAALESGFSFCTNCGAPVEAIAVAAGNEAIPVYDIFNGEYIARDPYFERYLSISYPKATELVTVNGPALEASPYNPPDFNIFTAEYDVKILDNTIEMHLIPNSAIVDGKKTKKPEKYQKPHFYGQIEDRTKIIVGQWSYNQPDNTVYTITYIKREV
jgi:hypothetical protein